MRREEMAACGVRLSLVYVTAPPFPTAGAARAIEVRLAWRAYEGEERPLTGRSRGTGARPVRNRCDPRTGGRIAAVSSAHRRLTTDSPHDSPR